MNLSMRTFNITKNTEIYVYGGGSLGHISANKLSENGYRIAGIIDKNADILSQDSYYRLFFPEEVTPNNEAVVIICVHNALWHESIVKVLYTIGWKNILFIPSGKQYKKESLFEMKKKYLLFQCDAYESLVDIPDMECMLNNIVSNKPEYIFENGEYVIVKADVLSLFSSLRYEEIEKRNAGKDARKYVGVPMPAMKPYIELFRYIENEQSGNVDDFIAVMKSLQDSFSCSDEEFIADRYELYYKLSAELNEGIEHFIYSASPCVFTKDGKLQLTDGMSRIIFLYIKGIQFVPILIARNMYEEYYNIVELHDVIKSVFEKKVFQQYSIEHPAFFDYPFYKRNRSFFILKTIEENMDYSDLNDKCILNEIRGFGALSRFFRRQGAVVTELIQDECDREMHEAINRLCHVAGIQFEISQKENATYHLICLETDDKSDVENVLIKMIITKQCNQIIWIKNGRNPANLEVLSKEGIQVEKMKWVNGEDPFYIYKAWRITA